MGRRRSILKANTTVTNVNSNETTFCEPDDTYFGALNEGKRRRRVSFNNSTYVRPIARVGQQLVQQESENSVGTTDDYQLPTRFKSAEENSDDFAHFRAAPDGHRQMTDITEASSIAASPFTSTKEPVNNSDLLNQTSIGLPSAPLSQPVPSSDYSIAPLQPKLSLDSLKGGINNMTISSVRNTVCGIPQQNTTHTSELNFSNISNGLPDLNTSRFDYRDHRNASNVRSADGSNSTKTSIDLLLATNNNVGTELERAANDEPSFLAQELNSSIFKVASEGDLLSQNIADLQLGSKVYNDLQIGQKNKTSLDIGSEDQDDIGSERVRNVEMSLVFSDDESMSPKLLSSSKIPSQSSPVEKQKKDLTTVEVAGNLTALFEQEPDIPVLKTPETKKSKEQSLLGKSIIGHKQTENTKFIHSFNSSPDIPELKFPMSNQLNLNGAHLLRVKSTKLRSNNNNKSPIDRLRESASKDIVERKLKRFLNQQSESNIKKIRRQVIACAVKPPSLEPNETEPRLKNVIDFEEQTNMTIAQANIPRINSQISSLKSNTERMHKFEMRKQNLHAKFERVWAFDTDKVMQRLQLIVEPTCVSDIINTGSSDLENVLRQLNPRASEQLNDARNIRRQLEGAREELENAKNSVELGHTLPRQKFGKSFLTCRVISNRIEMNYGKVLDVVVFWNRSNNKFAKMQISLYSEHEIDENRSKMLSCVIESLHRRKTTFQSFDVSVVLKQVHAFLSNVWKES